MQRMLIASGCHVMLNEGVKVLQAKLSLGQRKREKDVVVKLNTPKMTI